MKKHMLALAFFCMLFLFAAPETALATDANGDGYCDEDVAVINRMIDSNGLVLERDKPETWSEGDVVQWNGSQEKRIVRLLLTDSSLRGELLVNDLTELTSLEFANTEVTHLQTSNLPNLDVLNCCYTDVAELDLSSLPTLKRLYCIHTNITELDVAVLPNLEVLQCSGLDIERLDVENLIHMEVLYCDRTKITELDVSKMTNLDSLYCNDTSIDELDVADLTKLTNLFCSNTNISVLDVSKLTAMIELQCANTAITVLDVSRLTNMVRLDCSNTEIEALPFGDAAYSLSELYCSHTNISELNVSNMNLTSLFCSNTNLKELDISMHALGALDCSDTDIEELNISQSETLSFLDCSGTNITSFVVPESDYLPIYLVDLDCSGTNITELDLSKLINLQEVGVAPNALASFTDSSGHVLTVKKTGGGRGDVIMTEYVSSSDALSLTATPKPGHSFTGWTALPEGALVDGNTVSFTLDESSEVTASFQAVGLRGDVNRDNTVSLADAVLLARHLVGSATLSAEQLLLADVDAGGEVNVADVTALCGALVGGFVIPPL